MQRVISVKLGIVLFIMLIILVSITLYSFRKFSLDSADKEAVIISELVRDTLTSYMVMGVIDKREDFLLRIKEIPGVIDVKVLRGEAVSSQFGPPKDIEKPANELEEYVLSSGKPVKVYEESLNKVVLKVVIPYRAEPIKGINCLNCHNAKPGQTLGAISLKMDLTSIRSDATKTVAYIFISILLSLGVILVFIDRFFKPISAFFQELKEALIRAKSGRFDYEFKTKVSYEPAEVQAVIKDTFEKLDKSMVEIEDKISNILGTDIKRSGDLIDDTSNMVDQLLNVYKFKRVVEKDKSKSEVYDRIVNILNKFGFYSFSLYEVDIYKKRLKNLENYNNELMCNSIIFDNSEECRAKRTGQDVNSLEFKCICPNFTKDCNEFNYYCIPLYIGGNVGLIIQLVYDKKDIEDFKSRVSYLKVYLNEVAPVLEAKTYMDILREQSLKDQLTGLYNRRYLEETIDKLVAQTKRRKTNLGILMIDVDYFKQVNDTYGHDAGDKVLAEVAKVITKSIREADIVVRYGGEEFMVLLIDIQEGKSVDVAEKIRKSVEETAINIGTTSLKKTVSIGVSEFPVDSDKIWQCIKFADIALYKAKESGRNRVIRFSQDMWNSLNY
ncbi:MAG: GGDEF domain-containing protein [Hydrogenothermaceae bacterium]